MANPYSGLSKSAATARNQANSAIDKYTAAQEKNIKASTNQAITELNQGKARVDADLTKEGKSAYTDYIKSINPYGAGAENQAKQGLGSTGYAETTKMRNYNNMQNRIATARSTAEQNKQAYDNQIAQARLSQNSDLAELAYNKLNAYSQNYQNWLNSRISIAGGASDYALGKGQLDLSKAEYKLSKKQADRDYKLQKKELDFNIKQAKKNNASGKSSSKSKKSSGSKSSGSKRTSSSSSKKSTAKSSSTNRIKAKI